MSTRNRVQSPAPKVTIATSKTQPTKAEPKTFFQKYISPNVFNFYPLASLIGILYLAYKNEFAFDETMSNGGDRLVFFLCVKLCLLHNGVAHLSPKCTKIVHKSQGLTESPASLMFENELGAVCLSMSIFAILAGDGAAVATLAKVNGGFFFFAAARHIYSGQPLGTALGGIGTCVFLFIAGFHASPLNLPNERWPEGGALDRFDKTLSYPIHHLTLPPLVEIILSPTSFWFGCPAFALGVIPIVLAALPTGNGRIRKGAAPLVILAFGIWFKMCHASWTGTVEDLKNGHGIVSAYTMWFTYVVPQMISTAVATLAGSKEAATLVSHYNSSCLISHLVLEVVRKVTVRLRPIVALSGELETVPRFCKRETGYLYGGGEAHSSFGSGDAAAAAVFAIILATYLPRYKNIGIAVAAAAGFGAVYFHAHHLLDVLVGGSAGIAITLLMKSWVREPNWRHMACSQLLCLLLWGSLSELAPKGMQSAGRG